MKANYIIDSLCREAKHQKSFIPYKCPEDGFVWVRKGQPVRCPYCWGTMKRREL